MITRLRDPLVLLAALVVLSLAARVALLGEPCRRPCTSASDHVLVFDETYYVNAARVIAGIRPPPGDKYARAPLGTDPNAEHPQLAKLIIAGSIELFGDGPFAWRIGSIVFGTLALLGLFVLVRVAGGGRWLALGASALMAADNLLLIHGRIGTLDIYALAAMIWAVALYLRGRPVLAGIAIGIGASMKEVAVYALIVLALIEILTAVGVPGHGTARDQPPRGWARLAVSGVSAAVVFMALLTVLDQVAPPYDATVGRALAGGPLSHLAHIIAYARAQTNTHGATGIMSYPWQWLADYKPILYLNINPARPVPGLTHIHPATHFLGMISPPIMLLAVPSLVLITLALAGKMPRRLRVIAPAGDGVAVLALAWFLGTFVPFELISAVFGRSSYLYYMLIVMPGIYVAVAALVGERAFGGKTRIGWALMVLLAAVLMYPFTPLP